MQFPAIPAGGGVVAGQLRRGPVLAMVMTGLLAAAAAACSATGSWPTPHSYPYRSVEYGRGGATGYYLIPPGIHKIKHVIIVMQENRSFDTYFGTHPGADGIPLSLIHISEPTRRS